jgi:hypothetical protein
MNNHVNPIFKGILNRALDQNTQKEIKYNPLTPLEKEFFGTVIRHYIDTELKMPNDYNDEKICRLIIMSEKIGLESDFIEELKDKL